MFPFSMSKKIERVEFTQYTVHKHFQCINGIQFSECIKLHWIQNIPEREYPFLCDVLSAVVAIE